MTTGNFANWAGKILDIGPIYPFVGWEFTLFILALIFWLGWNVLQLRVESREFNEDVEKIGSPEAMKRALDRNGD